MASWKLSQDGIRKVRTALNDSKYEGQQGLATAADLAYSTVNTFCNGNNVKVTNFKDLCKLLGFEPQEVMQHSQDDRDSSPMSIDSYVIRTNEELWCDKILEPQMLIRIKAPVHFGKTSLMYRILNRASKHGHLVIPINLDTIDLTVDLSNPQIFLQQFIMQIESEIDERYSEILMSDTQYNIFVNRFGATKACLKYLEHLQKNISKPLTIGINKLDRLLRYPDTARTFFTLLRDMNEKSVLGGVWEKFRMVLAHSIPGSAIHLFIDLPDHQSPFNIGYLIDLPEFTSSEVADLASQRRVDLSATAIHQLMQSIGGIPYLVRPTLDWIQQNGSSSLMINPMGIDDIYQEHLQALSKSLQGNNLLSIMQEVVRNPDASSNLLFKEHCLLYRQGLVIFANNRVKARCELYQQHFLQSSDRSVVSEK
jgi:hypothetical protein